MHLSLSDPHPHGYDKPWERGTCLVLTQTNHVCLSLADKGKKSLFDNGALEGINMVPLFIDRRLDSLITRCSHHFRLCETSIYSCPVLGFSAPLILPALCISDTLSLERWRVLPGTMRCDVWADNMITLKLLFSAPQTQTCPLVLSLMFELEEIGCTPGIPDLINWAQFKKTQPTKQKKNNLPITTEKLILKVYQNKPCRVAQSLSMLAGPTTEPSHPSASMLQITVLTHGRSRRDQRCLALQCFCINFVRLHWN